MKSTATDMKPGLSFWLVCVLLSFSLFAVRSAPLKTGAVFYQTDFESSNALSGWSGAATIEAGRNSAQSLSLEANPAGKGATLTRRFAVEPVAGCVLRLTASVAAQSVSAKPNPWNGIKFMLIIEGPASKSYPQAPLETGTFDWQPAAFTARIPADATNLLLVLGLEQVTGKVRFDDVKVVVRKAAVQRSAPQSATGPVYTGHQAPRLRGTMISPNIDAAGLRVLGHDWNANVLRWQLIRFGRPGSATAPGAYDTWLENELKRLDAALPLCEQNGLMVVVDLHSPPGGKGTVSGYIGSDNGLFVEPKAQDKFVETWRKISMRYKDQKAIWGYDLANEPVEDDVAEGCLDWQGLAERAAHAIRAIDPARTIIVEPANWGGPDGLNELAPLPVSNVVYSVHMYLPHAFTHQGVHQKGPAYTYPGVIGGQTWDKAALERALQPAIDFQSRYHVQIYIGEFSAIRWAPDNSALRYLRDAIDVFEAHGWDWTYHAFREWSGWSVEHGSDPADTRPAATPTERQRLLCDWFARNQKP